MNGRFPPWGLLRHAVSSVKIVADATRCGATRFRDGRRMILKRCRATISRVLLVHEPAVCRLTYDRQQLINAFMSIRLAVHRRFKPRPVQPNPPTRLSRVPPSDQPTTQPPTHSPNERDTLPSFSLSLYMRACIVCSRVLFEQLAEICATTRRRYPLNERTITPVDIMY